MEAYKQCPRNSDGTAEKRKKTTTDIINEYHLKRNTMNPNNKSPNLFNKRLHQRMLTYYNMLNEKPNVYLDNNSFN